MMKPCRECGHQVANRAKICPSCGVKKPTATKAEANLDAVAATAFKASFAVVFLGLLVLLAVGCIVAVVA